MEVFMLQCCRVWSPPSRHSISLTLSLYNSFQCSWIAGTIFFLNAKKLRFLYFSLVTFFLFTISPFLFSSFLLSFISYVTGKKRRSEVRSACLSVYLSVHHFGLSLFFLINKWRPTENLLFNPVNKNRDRLSISVWNVSPSLLCWSEEGREGGRREIRSEGERR